VEHHKRINFADELKKFLKVHGMEEVAQDYRPG
jgi:hypothetical protein